MRRSERIYGLARRIEALDTLLAELVRDGAVPFAAPAGGDAAALAVLADALGADRAVFGSWAAWPLALGRDLDEEVVLDGALFGRRLFPGAVLDRSRGLFLQGGPRDLHLLQAVGAAIDARLAGRPAPLALVSGDAAAAPTLVEALTLAAAQNVPLVVAALRRGDLDLTALGRALGIRVLGARTPTRADQVIQSVRKALDADGPTLLALGPEAPDLAADVAEERCAELDAAAERAARGAWMRLQQRGPLPDAPATEHVFAEPGEALAEQGEAAAALQRWRRSAQGVQA